MFQGTEFQKDLPFWGKSEEFIGYLWPRSSLETGLGSRWLISMEWPKNKMIWEAIGRLQGCVKWFGRTFFFFFRFERSVHINSEHLILRMINWILTGSALLPVTEILNGKSEAWTLICPFHSILSSMLLTLRVGLLWPCWFVVPLFFTFLVSKHAFSFLVGY